MAVSYEVVTEFERFLALRDEWEALHRAADGAYLGQRHDWVRIAWETTIEPRGGRLFCLVGRRGGRLVLASPWAMERHSAWSMLRPLSSEDAEYTSVLVDPGEDAVKLVSAAFRILLRTCRCDLVSLPDVRADSPLGLVLARRGLRWKRYEQPAPWLRTRDFPDWETYAATVSSSRRAELRLKRRRLESLGEVRFEAVTDPERCSELIDWMIARKRGWMEEHGYENDWIFAKPYRDFLIAAFEAFAGEQGRVIFLLTVGGRPAAAELCSIDGRRLEGFFGAFDRELHKASPGQVSKELCIRWAFEHGLDFDMRMGDQAWKAAWANRSSSVTAYLQAASPWGAAYLAAQIARQAAMRRLPPSFKRAADALAARFTAAVAPPARPAPAPPRRSLPA